MSTVARFGVQSTRAGSPGSPPRINARTYGRLLERAAPAVIETDAEYQRMLAHLERLVDKDDASISPEEGRLLKLLAMLLEEYEDRNIPLPAVKPDKILRHLLTERGLRQSHLWPVLGSKSRVSEIIAGTRSISKSQAKKLAAFFRVPVELFI
ncbi:MAG: helix-turn-helix domain-containing protein [Terriglobia bacterium]|jgi:HTH-type transcriptional regulator/antitoxin HigA